MIEPTLIQRLKARAHTCYSDGRFSTGALLEDAADEIQRLEAENQKLRKATK